MLESGVHGLAQVNSRIAPRSRVSFCVNSSHFRAAQNAEPSGSAVSGIQAIRETGNSSAPERSEAHPSAAKSLIISYPVASTHLHHARLSRGVFRGLAQLRHLFRRFYLMLIWECRHDVFIPLCAQRLGSALA